MQVVLMSKVDAQEMTRLEYNRFRGWVLPQNEDGSDEGFLCKDMKTGHINWLPKVEFFSKVVS